MLEEYRRELSQLSLYLFSMSMLPLFCQVIILKSLNPNSRTECRLRLCYLNRLTSPSFFPSPVDGNFTTWGPWTSCSLTCGNGTRSRFRNCTNPPPQHGGNDCLGPRNETQDCFDGSCPGWHFGCAVNLVFSRFDMKMLGWPKCLVRDWFYFWQYYTQLTDNIKGKLLSSPHAKKIKGLRP